MVLDSGMCGGKKKPLVGGAYQRGDEQIAALYLLIVVGHGRRGHSKCPDHCVQNKQRWREVTSRRRGYEPSCEVHLRDRREIVTKSSIPVEHAPKSTLVEHII